MEDNRAEQKEALEVLMEFNGRVLKNMHIVIKELSGKRLDDTNQFLRGIIDAINWEVEVVNGTMELLNEDKERIKKEQFNAKIVAFSDAIAAKDDQKMADAVQALIPEFENFGKAAEEVTA